MLLVRGRKVTGMNRIRALHGSKLIHEPERRWRDNDVRMTSMDVPGTEMVAK